MAVINKIRVIRANSSNELEDKVNEFLEHSAESKAKGFCCMHLSYQASSTIDPSKHLSNSYYIVVKYSVMIHYVINK